MDENQRKEDDKDTSEAEPEGHSNTNATPPRPPTPPKPEGKDSQLDSKIDSLEEKIRLIQGLNSFGNTDFFEHVLVPQHDGATQVQGPGVREIQWERRPHDPSANLKKISHWKELADTFLAQYGFNSQIAPDRFDLQRMEKKSNETFREYAQRWREKAARARPPLDEREMIKIFVDTLKNPYFDRMMGLQMQFFVDLIPVGDRIEDALKTKKIVDMTALMALAEQAAKKAPTKRKEGDVQMIGRNNGRPRQVLPTFTMQPIQPRPIQAPAPTQAPAPAPAPQMPARPEGNQPNDNRWLRKEPRQFTPLPMPMTELYPILIEKSLISPIVPKPYNGPQRRDFNPNSACDFHFGEVGHTVENCGQLRHRVQDLIDHGVLKFEGLPNITTNPLPKHPEGGVNMVEVEEGNEESIAWRRLFYTLEKQKHITPLDAPPGPSTGDSCEYHSGARGHSLDCCEEFKKKVTDLMENGIEINLDDIVEDEMDLDNLQDEEADWGYFMEDDTDEWRDVDFTEFFQFPCLIVPPGFVTPEFEIFYEDGDPEVHLQKYGEKMALHLENELLMISVFPESLSKQTAAWFYQLRNLTGWDDLVRVFLERYRFNPHSILEYLALAEREEEEPIKTPPPNIITTTAEEEDAGPMVEGLSIHTIARRGGFHHTHRPTRHCQQGEEVKTWTCVPLLQRVSSSNEITRKTSNDPHVSKIDNKTDCSLDNIDNSDEEIELPSDILEALERQDEGSKPNIEELEIPEVILKIKEEVEKQLKAGFLSTVTYSDWVANIVPVPKKDGKVRMCVDYRDLNRASPKDNFPLPHIDTLVDNTATNVVFSFMDGFSGYNQIKMAEEDKSKTAFVTHWGTFVYDVMPFGLKNAGATYQRAMVTLFHDMIHHEIEVYVDDMIAKSRTAQDHLTDLRKLFQRLKKYQLRLNPNKCAFGVTSGKLLGFIVSGRGIEIDPAKDVPSFYTSQSKKHPWAACWDNKTRLGRKEQAIYYLSKKFTEPETRYLLVEKTCCALAWASKKLRQYMLYYTTWLVSRNGPDQAIKGQAIADYLADYPSEQLELMDSEFPDEDVMTVDEDNQGRWKLYFDGAANAVGSGIGAVLVSPKGQQTPIAVKLGFDCTNNMTEYEACIVGPGSQAHPVPTIHQPASPKVQTLKKANRLIQEMHAGLMGAHANGPFLARKIMRAGYYWLTMERDCIRHVQTCHKCQMYQNSKNAPPQYLHTMASPWPFSAWGMDVIEACSFKNVTQVAVTRFVKNNIICRYGMPEMLITDNASNLKQPHDGPVMPAVQDPAPQLCSIPSEDERSRRSCQQERHPLEPPPTLWYMGWKQYYQVEVEIPSLRILSQTQLEEAEWAQARYEQLNFIDEKRLAALCHGQLYQRRIERAYNKKARPRTFQPGDLVLKKRNMALSDPRGKFAPSYEGPYVVKKAFSGGAIILADMDGEEFRSPINSDSVIKYHV
uniref:Reverse transcriptase domain-containing protein n=1 Tax=Fagus sylvatica TaxID=28930 RepID=A0A2N9H1A8_FAGSY